MQNINAKNRNKIFLFVGRLEKEKGVDILLDILSDPRNGVGNWEWHIFGDGSWREKLQKKASKKITIHGNVDKNTLNTYFRKADLTLMPSRFLETFGLVALESLSLDTPVCGFQKGGLTDMIPESLALDTNNPIESFFGITKQESFEMIDIAKFRFDKWKEDLDIMTQGHKKILLVSDYTSCVGGAETYTHELKKALESKGKQVELYGYSKPISPFMRKVLFLFAPFAFWRGKQIQHTIREFDPDLIWCGSILRYIGPWGMRSIAKNRKSKKWITHHDIGLIASRPSSVDKENMIPKSLKLSDWIRGERSIFAIFAVIGKWCYIRWIWRHIFRFNTQIVPSSWMSQHFPKSPEVHIFPHTIFPEEKNR